MATFRSVLRSLDSAAKKSQREAVRRRRELEKNQIRINKLEEKEQAVYEFKRFDNELEVLQSMHKDCSEFCDWEKLSKLNPPTKPIKNNSNEKLAIENFKNYKPKISDKILKKVDKIKESLKEEIEKAKNKDEFEFQEKNKKYEKDIVEHKENINFANKILEGDLSYYKNALEEVKPFTEITQLGTTLSIEFPSKEFLQIEFNVHSEEIIPKEIKTLLKSGKLSIKSMPIGRFNEIYQDHICSSILRIARESFASLPISKVEINALANLLNSQTGFAEEMSIVSVMIPKTTLFKLNFENIDPSESMKNFLNKMNFSKTKGFSPVDKIDFTKFY